MSSLEMELIHIILVFVIAGGVGALTAKYVDLPYTIALLLTGIFLSFIGVQLGIELSHDLIILVLLPPLLFEGAATTDLDFFRERSVPILLIALVGLIISILFLGISMNIIFGIPLLIALLFSTIILPTDPVSVLAIFKELGAPEQLSVLLEGESLINDGVAVVLYTTLLALIAEGETAQSLLNISSIYDLFSSIGISIIGGLLVGLVIGYLSYLVMVNLDDDMTEVIITICLAYGSFLVAEHYLGVSGVLATVAVGLFVGNKSSNKAMSATTKLSVFNTWETASFIVNTFIFIAIGVLIPISSVLANYKILIPTIILVLLARGIIVYPLSWISNRITKRKISIDYQHIMVWGGLHASIPIALALGLPSSIESRTLIQTLVFGVATFSLIVQGLTMDKLLKYLEIIQKTEEEKMYERLVGLERSYDESLKKLEKLYSKNQIPSRTYNDLKSELENNKNKINNAISNLMIQNPNLYDQRSEIAKKRIYTKQKESIKTSNREGIISNDIAEELLDEININIDILEEEELEESNKEVDLLKEAKEMGLLDEDEEDEKDDSIEDYRVR